MLQKSKFLNMPANHQAEEVSIMLKRLVRWVAAARAAGSPLFIVHDDSKQSPAQVMELRQAEAELQRWATAFDAAREAYDATPEQLKKIREDLGLPPLEEWD